MIRPILCLSAFLAMGCASLGAPRVEQAREQAPAEAGGSEDAESVQTLAGLCRAQLEQGLHGEAVATAVRWVELAQTPAERSDAYYHLGLGLLRSGVGELYPGAGGTVEPRPLEPPERLPNEVRGTELLQQAAEAFRKAASEQSSGQVLLSLADTLVRLREYTEALEVLDDFDAGGGEATLARDLRCWAEWALRDADGQGLPTDIEVKPPIKVYAPPPQFSEEAREARINGAVIVTALIDKEGRVVCARAVTTLPKGLDGASVEAVKQWRFQPATLDGEPIATIYNLTLNFDLR